VRRFILSIYSILPIFLLAICTFFLAICIGLKMLVKEKSTTDNVIEAFGDWIVDIGEGIESHLKAIGKQTKKPS